MKQKHHLKKGRISIFRSLLFILFLFYFNNSVSQGRVLINEYLSWPANGCAVTSEYIELYNFGPGPMNIGCYVITDGDYAITIPPNTILQPGQFFVIAGQNLLPLGCANDDKAVTVNLNWNTCNCTSAPIPTTGDGLMTDGGSGSEQLVLLDPSMNMVDAIVRDLSETSSAITTTSLSGQCTPRTFDLDDMSINYEQVGESQGRANSFARRIDGGCGWLKDPQQSGGATNNTPGASSDLNASISVTTPLTCTNTGAAAVYVNSGDFNTIFPMRYTLARDIDSNNIYSLADVYSSGIDSTANSVPVNNLVPGRYRIVVETKKGCDLRSFDFNILACPSGVLQVGFSSFAVMTVSTHRAKLSWTVGDNIMVQSFVIQKSRDGLNFSSYAKITDVADSAFRSGFTYYDDQATGIDYYRIQLITREGNASYSSVNKAVSFAADPKTNIYPNPFNNNINVSLHGTNSGKITMILYDVFGTQVKMKTIDNYQGNPVTLHTNDLPAGTYFLKWQTASGKILETKRMIKLKSSGQ